MSEVWFSPLHPFSTPISTGYGTQQSASGSLFDLSNDHLWQDVIHGISVFKVYLTDVSNATDAQIIQMSSWLADNHIKLALEMGVLNDPPSGVGTGAGVEGYVAPLYNQLSRLQTLGANLSYVAMDEPYYFGSQYNGPNAAHATAADIAKDAVETISEVKTYFPTVQVGDTEPIPYTTDMSDWFAAFAKAYGQPLSFLHADMVWGLAYDSPLQSLSNLAKSYGTSLGLIYNGTPSDTTNVAWTNDAIAHYKRVEAGLAIHVDQGVIQTWAANPTVVIPAAVDGSLSSLAKSYEAFNSLGPYLPDSQAATLESSGLVLSNPDDAISTTDHSKLLPFARLNLASGLPDLLVTATVSIGQQGTIGDPSAKDQSSIVESGDAQHLILSGALFAVQAALQRVVFQPFAHIVAPGLITQTGISLKVVDSSGTNAVTQSVISVAALPDPIQVAGLSSTVSVTTAGRVTPFAAVVLTDPDSGISVTATVSAIGSTGQFAIPVGSSAEGGNVTFDETAGIVRFTGNINTVESLLRQLRFYPTDVTMPTPSFSLVVAASPPPPSVSSPIDVQSAHQPFSCVVDGNIAKDGNSQYGYKNAINGPFFLASAITTDGTTSSYLAPSRDPYVGEYVIPEAGILYLHPGEDNYAAVSITVPITDLYTVSGSFGTINDLTTTDVHVVVGGVELFDARVNKADGASFSLKLTIPALTSIEFVVGNGGNGFYNDSTILAASIIGGGNVGADAEPVLASSAVALSNTSGLTLATAIGVGPDAFLIDVSEDAYLGDACFTVSVNGLQIGGVQTASASHHAGATQALTVNGSFGAGPMIVSVNFLNDLYDGTPESDRNLYVDLIAANGWCVPGASLQSGGPQTLFIPASAPSSPSASLTVHTTVGSGSDTITLYISEDAYLGDAAFTIAIDGNQIGSVETAMASHKLNASQAFNIRGDFGSAAHIIGVTFLNDRYDGTSQADRNLYVDRIVANGVTSTGGPQWSSGLVNYQEIISQTVLLTTSPTQNTINTPLTPLVLGSGPDRLVLQMSEDAYQGDAQFTVSIDGQQLGGVQVVTALHRAGAEQNVTIQGSYSGVHTLTVNFLNDKYDGSSATDRNLYVDSSTFNGAVINNATLSEMGTGPQSIRFMGNQTADLHPGSTSVLLSEDAYLGNAQFSVSIDGAVASTPVDVTTRHLSGLTQAFSLGILAQGTHDVAVSFMNDRYDGTPTTDRNLYVDGFEVGGKLAAVNAAALYSSGTQHFSITIPS